MEVFIFFEEFCVDVPGILSTLQGVSPVLAAPEVGFSVTLIFSSSVAQGVMVDFSIVL